MPRPNTRLYRKMATETQDIITSSPDESGDEENTIIEEPTVAELKEEIFALKETLRQLTAAQNALPPTTREYVQLTSGTPSEAAPAVTVNDNAHLTTGMKVAPAGSTPQSRISTSEYSTNFQFNMPYTTAQSLAPRENYLPQTFIPKITPSPHISQSPMPTTSTFSISPLFAPTMAQSKSIPAPNEFIQQRPSQICTSTQSHIATSTSMHPPIYSSASPFNIPVPQAINDCRPLRKLHDLPQFSGLPEQWPMFIVAYRETTVNYNYSNLENLIRLQRSLTGDARSKVEAFLIHPDSVGQVISTLEFHYGRPQVLIRSQIAKVKAFPPISTRKMYELVNFSTMVSNLSAFLISANATPHLSNPTLLDELVSKLPLQKREEWTKHSMTHLGPYPTVQDFSVWLQEVATYVYLSVEADSGKTEAAPVRKEKMNPSFTIIPDNAKPTRCPMCHQGHQLYQCSKFKESTTNQRWTFVKNNRLCFGSLRAGHNTIDHILKL